MNKTLLIASMLLFIQPTYAAPNEQVGGIEFEEEQTENLYDTSQEQAISFFQQLSKSVTDGQAQRPLPLSANAINYLNAAYLYCISTKGVCREIPQTIYEADVITSKLDNKAGCPLSLSFWRAWLKNDMEERSKFVLKTSHLRDADEFTRKIRPNFIQCEKTIGALIEESKAQSANEFFSQRYKEQTIERNSVTGGVQILNIIKEKIPNVFSATGSATSEPKNEDSKSKAKMGSKSSNKSTSPTKRK